MTQKNTTVLIIDDEVDLRNLLKTKLLSEGFNVLEAENGKIGLEMILSLRPDIVLLDIIMPVMDGQKMLEELRKHEYGKEVPVIILSNLGRVDETVETIQFNVKDYLVKSDYEPEDIVDLVRKRTTGQK
jgi:two-component system alkaline phosphatase synthesis response regulator PhoP